MQLQVLISNDMEECNSEKSSILQFPSQEGFFYVLSERIYAEYTSTFL